METFQHIKTVLSIILGLSITHLLKGAVRLVQHPGRAKPYLVHLLWTFYLFLVLVHFWWWEYQLRIIVKWDFAEYFFVIGYITVYYLLCALLYPDDLKDFDGYEDYFYRKKIWFFAVLAITYLADTVDTLIKGKAYFLSFSWEYVVRVALHVILCLLAIRINNKKFHLVLVLLFLLYELSFIWRMYAFERSSANNIYRTIYKVSPAKAVIGDWSFSIYYDPSACPLYPCASHALYKPVKNRVAALSGAATINKHSS